jgi:hypothetical protein
MADTCSTALAPAVGRGLAGAPHTTRCAGTLLPSSIWAGLCGLFIYLFILFGYLFGYLFYFF